jgi:hypothetical protein
VTAAVVIGVIATLLIVWCVTVAVVMPPEIRRGVGGCLLGIGLLNLILHRRFGSQAFSGGRRVSRLWDDLGERASQRMYFAIGVLLALFGAILIVLSLWDTGTPSNPRLQRTGASVAALPPAPAAEPPGR